ncbi:MAG TPA: methylmalonyl Co-A mutase-associated GTPase MeaB, partial [Candidatus Poseidoniaceae archaeon]
MRDLIQDAAKGDRRSLARTLSALENRTIELAEVFKIVEPVEPTGDDWQSLAITGAPGVGKSCLLDGLLTHWARA